jgi:glycosyltransferase involved in cell wall biosynthesis
MANDSKKVRDTVALFMPDFGGGGAEKMMLNLCGALLKGGHRVDLVVLKRRGPYESMVPGAANVIELGAGRMLKGVTRLAAYLRRTRPQVLLSTMFHANICALLARRLACVDTRVVIRIENNMTEHISREPAPTAAIGFAYRLMPYFYPKADRIIAVSHGVADDLARRCRIPVDRIDTVYSPVLTPRYYELLQEPVDDPWFAGDAPPVILSVGRLTRQKDFKTLIRAFAKVRKMREARLVIIGEGEERQSLERLAAESGVGTDVRLPGFLDNPYKYMRHSAVFAISSAWEGFPNVLVEAMGAGVPAVATDCPSGPREILKGGRYGLLVPVGEHEKIADAILRQIDGNKPYDVPWEWIRQFESDFAIKAYMSVLEK